MHALGRAGAAAAGALTLATALVALSPATAAQASSCSTNWTRYQTGGSATARCTGVSFTYVRIACVEDNGHRYTANGARVPAGKVSYARCHEYAYIDSAEAIWK